MFLGAKLLLRLFFRGDVCLSVPPALVREETGDNDGRHQARQGDRQSRVSLPPLPQTLDRPGPPRGNRKAVDIPPQVLGHLPRRLITPVRVLVQCLQADCFQIDRNLLVDLPRRLRFLVDDLRQHLVAPLAGEGRLQCQKLVQRGAERINVGAVVQGRPPGGNLLRRHVGGRADELAGRRHPRLLQYQGQPEIVDAQPAGWCQEEVRRLDVAVDHPLLVGILQAVGDLGDHPGHSVEVAAARVEHRRIQPRGRTQRCACVRGRRTLEIRAGLGQLSRVRVAMVGTRGLRCRAGRCQTPLVNDLV